ncbi:para-aminobenzoate synthetase component 1 [Acetoanaerobium pronyense]|uniref:aminodeoxychorismate synthase n=1 Tax=Acetoanaerobium pronyense TaxID=1482736 RepID=A0ABS4KGW1_9FIRM|nr:aminodeoxychorismate synthase component I [Acetoanaerobium pronyense]MBP2026371.1 para-aminobenzoate synthetase component 1 [Acetoanaerobium pronyense]
MIIELNTSLEAIDLYDLIKEEPYSFILESSLYNERYGRYTVISSSPFEILKYENDEECIDKFKDVMSNYKSSVKGELPFYGGAVGYISYDTGRYFEDIDTLAKADINIPDIYFGLYDWAFVVDHKANKTYIVSPEIDIEKEKNILEKRKKQVYEAVKTVYKFEPDEKILLKGNMTKEYYLSAIEKVREYIRIGDIYQANFTQRFEGETSRTGYDIYRKLREVSPTIFGGFLDFKDVEIISNSPERFLELKNNTLETRPIKGTRPRGKTIEEDQKLKQELLNSSKDKAELLMIVDLERNDLGRVSKIGTVKVPELFVIEEYASVNHLVATVKSELDENKDIFDVIKNTFPGGSITGAPKIKAMQVIEELEPTRRNVYTGSIGYIGFNQNSDFNIAIRTILKKEKFITFQVGGGITYDSSAEDEYMESLHKARSIVKALNGTIENEDFI